MPKHFHTGYYPDKNIAINAGVRKLLELAIAGQHADAKIWFFVKTNVETILKPHLNSSELKQFQKGSLRVGPITLHLATSKLPSILTGPTLALFPDGKQLRPLAEDTYTTELLYVPWMEEWLADYLLIYPNSTHVEPVAK